MPNILTRVLQKRKLIVKAEGQSMWPIIYDKDLVEITKTSFKVLKTNDIVLIKKKGRFIIHRLIYKRNSYIITKGDNSPVYDGKIYKSQIVGKAENIIREKKRINLNTFYLIQSSIYLREIIKLNESLSEKKLDFVYLKGLPTNLYFFKKHPSRFYFDCDLLIKDIDKNKVKKIMNMLGYKKIGEDLSKKNTNTHYWEESYIKTINGFPVIFDIHYQAVFLMTQIENLNLLYEREKINKLTNLILKEKTDYKYQNIVFPILSPVNSSLYFLLHFFHHNYQGIHRLELIDKSLKKLKTKQLLELLEKIRLFNLENYLLPAFKMLNTYFPNTKYQTIANNLKSNKKLFKLFKIDVFSNSSRLDSGTKRFMLIFFLSPRNFFIRGFVFFNPEVIRLIFLVLKTRYFSKKEN